MRYQTEWQTLHGPVVKNRNEMKTKIYQLTLTKAGFHGKTGTKLTQTNKALKNTTQTKK